jgi:quinol monooxygenase YgiN
MERSSNRQKAPAAEAAGPHRYAITVDFELEDGARERFLSLVRANAAASVRDEPGCVRFDVLTPRGQAEGPDRVFLYEIYADRAAFEAHLKTAHFLAFDAATQSLVRRKTVHDFEVTEAAKD